MARKSHCTPAPKADTQRKYSPTMQNEAHTIEMAVCVLNTWSPQELRLEFKTNVVLLSAPLSFG